MKRDNCDKFDQYTICGCQTKNFQIFAYQFNIHVGSISGVFFAYFSSICGPIFVKLWPPSLVTPERWQKSEKNIPTLKKISYRTIQVYQNQGPFSSPFYGKNRFIFCIFGLKTGEHHRSNGQNENLTQLISPKWL